MITSFDHSLRYLYRTACVVLTALLGMMLYGCHYERIELRSGRNDVYGGMVLSHYKDVEVGKGVIRLKPGARFAIRTERFTQTVAQLEVAIIEGTGMNLYTRTIANEFDPSHGAALRYSTEGCALRLPDGSTVPLNYRADYEQQYLQIYNEADLLTVFIGCDQVYEGHVAPPATEYLIVETLPGSTVELRSVFFFETNIR